MPDALERLWKRDLILELRNLFPGCVILKNDPNELPGIPDLVILYGPYWAALECKKHEKAIRQPNQEDYVEMLNEWSFAAFIYPANKDDVLNELQHALQPRRNTRVSQR